MSPYDTIPTSLFYLEQIFVLTCLPPFLCAGRHEEACEVVSKLPEVTLKAFKVFYHGYPFAANIRISPSVSRTTFKF